MAGITRKPHDLFASALALLLTVLIALSGTGCELIPDDVAPTLPAETGRETTANPVITLSPLLITEIMSRNTVTLQTADQQTPDWIEFYNSGQWPINLAGYGLSDNLNRPNRWQFPSVVIEPGEYLLIYCSGLSPTAESEAAGEIHVSFRLNNEGENLYLVSPAGQMLALLTLPLLPPDISYGLAPGSASPLDPYFFFGEPTPGRPNGPDGKTTAEAAIPKPEYDLVVNEFMTRNTIWPDAFGNLPDWVEIRNYGSEALNLNGFWLSDNPGRPDSWLFPDVTIEPGQLLVIWLSGLEIPYDPAEPSSLHASFALGRQDEFLLMSDPSGNLVFKQPIEFLPANLAKGRSAQDPDNWLYFPAATPGSDNTTAGFAEISGAMSLKNRGIWISEVMAMDARLTAAGNISQPDWIELFNGTGETIELEGYGLSDRTDEPFRMTLGNISINPGQHLVINPSGFGISGENETIYLTSPNEDLIDWFETGLLKNGISSGRGNTGGEEPAGTRFFYARPTPGRANDTAASLAYALAPNIEVRAAEGGGLLDGLYFDGTVMVTLTSPQPDAVIRYTLDGSAPTASSSIFREPFALSRTTVIRSRTERPDHLPSRDVSRTLLTGVRHELPVVSIAVNPADFTGPGGVWTDFAGRHEAPISFTFYEPDGTLGISSMASVSLHGAFSRRENQKSMEIKLRAVLGNSQIIYPFFPDNESSTFRRLILRTSGQDWRISKLRDAFMSEVVEGHLAVDTMDWRPCVLYVNGEYYGLYEVREKVDQFYMAINHGTDPDNVDIIKGNAIVHEGDMLAYRALLQYVRTNDMRNETAYRYVLSQIDELSLMDWIIAQTFFNNLDSGNKKFWRERTDGAQWRWVFFDLDWAMFPTTYTQNILKYDLLHPDGHGQRRIFDSTLQVRLMENTEFRNMFIERYAELMNTVFLTDRMLSILDDMTEQIRSEIPGQVARWGGPISVTAWEQNVAILRRITSEKRDRMKIILRDTFNLSDDRMRELFPGEYP